MSLLMTRAGPAELAGLLEARAELTLSPLRYGRLLAQVVLSDSYAVWATADARLPLAIAGIAPFGKYAGEIWFGVRAGGLGSNLLPIVRRARQVLRSRAPAYPGGLMCLVVDGHLPGKRLARLIGCVPQDVFLDGHREWSWADELRVESVRGVWSEGAGRGAAAGGAAAAQ